MARIHHKRKRSSSVRRPFKRRRVYRFKRRGGSNQTSLNTSARTIRYAGRRISRFRYRSHLWNSTLFSSHNRSLATITETLTTPASNLTGILRGFNMYRFAAPNNPFWEAIGGTQPMENGGTVRSFTGDIILRGGVYDMNVHNQGANDIRVRAMFCRTVADPVFALEPALPPYNWDPSITPDFTQQVAKIWKTMEVLIEGGNSWSFREKFKMQKVDPFTYNAEGNSPLVYLLVSNVGSSVANNVVVTRGYNISFVGDAI